MTNLEPLPSSPPGEILVVEDNPLERFVLVRLLRKAGHLVREAASGEEGLAQVRDKAPDLILLDIRMDGMDGLEVCRRLKEDPALKEIPVVFLTALREPEDRVKGLLAGAVDYIGKPYQAEEVLARVNTHLAFHRRQVHLAERLQERTEALESERQRLLDIISFLPDATFVIDPEKRVVAWNRAAEQLTGVKQEEVLGHGDYAYAAPFFGERRPMLVDLLDQPDEVIERSYEYVRKAGGMIYAETFIPRLNGGEGAHLWGVAAPLFDTHGRRSGAVEVVRDVTERKKREEAQRESDRTARAILDISFGFIGLLSPEGVLLDVNRTALDFARVSREAVVGRPFWDCPWWNHDPAAQEQIRAAVDQAAQGRLVQFETTHRSPDGALHIIDVSLKPVLDESGQVRLLIPEGRDITDRKHAESSREQAQAQLVQAQKMEVVGRLAGGVAHDFNNMLGVILGRADLIMSQLDPSSTLFESAREILKAAEHSANLTRQLLAFARRQAVTPRVLDLNETVEGMLKMLGRLIGENIELQWLPAKELWPLRVDPTQVDQVLANLCLNARDAIPGVGRISIETGNVVLDAAFCSAHYDAKPGDHVLLQVSDNGSGMEKEVLEHIFEPFFSTKGLAHGTGLGLATVYGIVQQNDGFILVHSEPGQGSSFKIYLPRAASKEPAASPDPARTVPRGGGELLLVVEDDDSLRDLSREVLERLDYRVIVADCPDAALALADSRLGEIALLVTDVIMPGMNGRELAERLRELKPGLKCLFMSGYTSNVILGEGVFPDGAAFLQKPYTRKDLATKVRELLDSERP